MIVKSELDEIQNYLTDSSNLKGFCEKVIIPETVDELTSCIKDCYESDIPYTISAGGTGLVGGRVPFEGVLVSTERINQIIEFNPESQYVVAEAGVIRKDLDEFLENQGYFLPPNPTETSSYVGGNLACNSSGARTFKYGTIRDYALELDIVLPDGEKIFLKRDEKSLVTNNNFLLQLPNRKRIEFKIPTIPKINASKNTAGYYLYDGMHLLDLFIGSEGSLGTIVSSKFKILPKPENVLGLIVFFDQLEKSLDFIAETRDMSKINQSNLPSARLIEFFDRNSLNLALQDYPEIPTGACCAVWIEQEYEKNEEEKILTLWLEHIAKFSIYKNETWVALNDSEHRRFAEFRHSIPTRVFELVAQTKYPKIGSDVAVNDCLFKKYFLNLVEQLDQNKLQYFIWGHFGNSHLHLNIVPRSEEENKLSHKIYDWHIMEALSLGGTYSAEHGTGKLKRKYLELMYGKDIVLKMKEIKLIFDPKNLLGRGNLFF